MKKSKYGSAFIVTIITVMFVTTVSVAFLSMITSNYYGRVSESKRTQNLYGSDSGLDTTYNIIVKTVEAASIDGNEKVKKLKEAKYIKFSDYENLYDEDQKALYALYADIEYWKYYNGNLEKNENPLNQETIDTNIKRDSEDIDKLINKVFKSEFKNFMKNNLKTSIEKSQYIQFVKKNDGTYVQNSQPEVVDVGNAKIIFGKIPTKTNTQENINAVTNISGSNEVIPKAKGNIIEVNRTLKVESGYDDDGRIEYQEYTPVDVRFNEEEDYDITVTSEFETDSTKENTVKVGGNLRIIEANYSIRVPNYNEVAFKESTENVDKPDELVGLTIGEDMNVKDVKKLNVTGDIFVQGKEFNQSIDSKYSGGIILDDGSEIS